MQDKLNPKEIETTEVKTILKESNIEYMREEGHYRLNIQKGPCLHECKWCYMVTMARQKPDAYFRKPTHLITNAAEVLEKDILRLKERGKPINDIMLSTSHDAFPMVGNNEGYLKVTAGVIGVLMKYDLPFRILTKGVIPDGILKQMQGYKKVRVGITLTSLERQESEKYAASPDSRITNLVRAKRYGLKTWVSMEPLYPNLQVSNPFSMIDIVRPHTDEYKFGRKNYMTKKEARKHGFQDLKDVERYYYDLGEAIRIYCNGRGIKDFLIKEEMRRPDYYKGVMAALDQTLTSREVLRQLDKIGERPIVFCYPKLLAIEKSSGLEFGFLVCDQDFDPEEWMARRNYNVR